jgi:hypothetical protein
MYLKKLKRQVLQNEGVAAMLETTKCKDVGTQLHHKNNEMVDCIFLSIALQGKKKKE